MEHNTEKNLSDNNLKVQIQFKHEVDTLYTGNLNTIMLFRIESP